MYEKKKHKTYPYAKFHGPKVVDVKCAFLHSLVTVLRRDAPAANKLSQNELKPNAAYYRTHFQHNVYLNG